MTDRDPRIEEQTQGLMNTTKPPNIFNYSDYRVFLNDYVTIRKSASRSFNLTRFAKELDLKDASSINKILRGQREPGPSVTERLCHILKLEDRHARYFCDLVALRREKETSLNRMYILDRLKRLNPKGQFYRVDLDKFALMSRWYCFAIREMVKTKGFKSDPAWIAETLNRQLAPKSSLRVSVTQVKEALQTLLRLDLLELLSNGSLKIKNGDFDTPQDIPNEGLKMFHEEMITHGREALQTVPVELRQIAGTTFAFNQNQLGRAKKIIDEAHDQITALITASDADGDSVYQLNIQFFPLSLNRLKLTPSKSKPKE